MQSIVVICLLLVGVTYALPQERYTDRYDNVNLSEIIGNRRLLAPYVKCALDQGKCTPDGLELKSHIQEALENNCAKCTEAQRNGTRQVIGHLINNEPEYWQQMKQKYDPSGKYVQKYEADLRTVKA